MAKRAIVGIVKGLCVAGGLIVAVALLVTRRWLPGGMDLGLFGRGTWGEIPGVMLPLVGALLGALFEIDARPEPAVADTAATTRQRVAAEPLPATFEAAEAEAAVSQSARRRK